MGNLRLAQVPEKHHTALFTNLVQLRGVDSARQLVQENSLLAAAFPWCFSNEGHKFWQAIEDGDNPTTITTTTCSKLDKLVKEAEARGFAVGVSTKFGEIRERNQYGEIYEHELCDDGSFFYRNIRVLSAKGKWCKPGKKENPEHKKEFTDARAIHALLDEIFSIRKN